MTQTEEHFSEKGKKFQETKDEIIKQLQAEIEKLKTDNQAIFWYCVICAASVATIAIFGVAAILKYLFS